MLAAALKGKVAHPSCSTFTKYCSYSSIGNACKRSCGHCGGSSGGKGSSSGGKGGSSSSGSCKDNNAALKSALGGKKMGGNPSCSKFKLYCTSKGFGSKLVSARRARFVQISSSGTGVGRQVSGSPYLLSLIVSFSWACTFGATQAAICPKTCGHCGGSASTGTGTVSSSSKPMNCSSLTGGVCKTSKGGCDRTGSRFNSVSRWSSFHNTRFHQSHTASWYEGLRHLPSVTSSPSAGSRRRARSQASRRCCGPTRAIPPAASGPPHTCRAWRKRSSSWAQAVG